MLEIATIKHFRIMKLHIQLCVCVTMRGRNVSNVFTYLLAQI